MYRLVSDLAADGVPVAVTCRVLKVCKQAYYRWLRSPVSARDYDDAVLINHAVDIHHDDPAFGYRFIKDELETRGIVTSEDRVNRLCTSQRLWSFHARKRGLSRRSAPPVHDDLVAKNFTAAGPNRVWLTDISEHPTSEGKLLCAVKDLWSNRIVGYAMADRMTADLAVTALRYAYKPALPTSHPTVDSSAKSLPDPPPHATPTGRQRPNRTRPKPSQRNPLTQRGFDMGHSISAPHNLARQTNKLAKEWPLSRARYHRHKCCYRGGIGSLVSDRTGFQPIVVHVGAGTAWPARKSGSGRMCDPSQSCRAVGAVVLRSLFVVEGRESRVPQFGPLGSGHVSPRLLRCERA